MELFPLFVITAYLSYTYLSLRLLVYMVIKYKLLFSYFWEYTVHNVTL